MFFSGVMDEASMVWEEGREERLLDRNYLFQDVEDFEEFAVQGSKIFPESLVHKAYSEKTKEFVVKLGKATGPGAGHVPGPHAFRKLFEVSTDIIVEPDGVVETYQQIHEDYLPVAEALPSDA